MKRLALFFLASTLISLAGPSLRGQDFTYSWQRVRMDQRFESKKIYKVDSILAEHQEQIAPLMEIVAQAREEISKSRQPESALCNIAADMLLYSAAGFIDNGYPTLSLTNRGGIRSNFPKGAVRIFDIYSTFPFDNLLVVAVLKGEDVREILRKFAKEEKFEALGGVEIEVEDGKLRKCLIGGTPLQDDKLYNLVTIDFLLNGGDRFDIREDAVSVTQTGILMRDAAVRYLRSLQDKGVVLENKGDGRIKLKK